MKNFREKADLIWRVADLLRGDYKQSDYGKVILPMTVLRRLDSVLAPTKDKVMAALPSVEKLPTKAKDLTLNRIAGRQFHNASPYDFRRMVEEPSGIAGNLRHYINGFSTSAREILEYFDFDQQIDRLDGPKTDLLYKIVKEFAAIDLSDMGSLEMGYAFEHLIRKFAELSNETAGEHFTPREVIRLMVNLLFTEDRDALRDPNKIYTVYDPACGTGGMLSEGQNFVRKLRSTDGEDEAGDNYSQLRLFGQEINPESYAICKADLLIKGQDPRNIKFGNTFTVDGLRDEQFDYLLSNPPFGVSWKKAEKIIKAEADKMGYEGRFGAGTPRINDGSLLFLQHMISKMKPGGSRIAVVFNGSPLFSGAAGSGESDIRGWIIENDWLEAIVALPDQLFYNTGISTYVWIVTNKKSAERKGKVQLIDATGKYDDAPDRPNRFWEKMPRSLGDKRKRIPENGQTKGVGFVARLYGDFTENEFCKIYPNDFFGYRRVTVEQPLTGEDGAFVYNRQGEAKPDKTKRDTENIPFLRRDRATGELLPQTIEEYIAREVHPHLPHAWVDESRTKTGYEINFTKYFYRFQPLRSLADIRADILALERKTRDAEQTILDV